MRLRRLLVTLLTLAAGGAVALPGAVPPASAGGAGKSAYAGGGARHSVTYDQYSLKLDGRRILVQAAEFHYFRLPSPALWRDILEKDKAAGFNAVSLYFDWAYHSPKPHVYDFTGVRDVDRLLRTAEDVGLWVIARPGP